MTRSNSPLIRLRGGNIHPFHSGQILQEFNRVEVGIDSKILWEIPKHGAQIIRLLHDINAVPLERALRRPRDRGQDVHESALACAIWAQQAEHAGLEFQIEILQRRDSATVSLAQMVDLKFQGVSPKMSAVRRSGYLN